MSRNDHREEGNNFEVRLYVVEYLILAVFVALGIRFYVLQVGRHQVYEQAAENNRIREIPILATRGHILDRYGRILVDSTPVSNVVVYPETISNREETISVLVQNFGVERSELMAQVMDPRRPKSQPILVKQ